MLTVHAFFVVEVLFALPFGGMVNSTWAVIVFFPHFMLIYSLPPKYPFESKSCMVGKFSPKLWMHFLRRYCTASL